MAQRNEVKPRKCDCCLEMIETTAQGIKDHAATCNGKVAK